MTRDPIAKTLVELTLDRYPEFTDEQVAEHIRKHSGCSPEVMTAEIAARWRAEAAR